MNSTERFHARLEGALAQAADLRGVSDLLVDLYERPEENLIAQTEALKDFINE